MGHIQLTDMPPLRPVFGSQVASLASSEKQTVGSVSPFNGQLPNSGHFTTQICTKFTTGTVLFLEYSK